MEKLWWSKRVLLVSLLTSKFLSIFKSNLISSGLKFIFLVSTRSDRCFRLKWPMDLKADFFRHSDTTKPANMVLIFHFSFWLFSFYFLHCPSSLSWKERSWASELIYIVLVRGSFFKRSQINPMGLPLCYLFFLLFKVSTTPAIKIVGSGQHVLVFLWKSLHHTGFPGGSC